ncbi:hypothetical protein RI054_01g02620 [Pseudoscourfieldia marina]
MMTTNVRNMRSIVTASSAVLVALLAVVVMLSAVSGVSADKSTTTTYETTKYVDEYNSGYYGEEYKSGYYPKYKWWAPWTWKYSSNKYNDNKYDSGYDSGYSKYGSGYSKYDSKYGVGPYYGKQYEQDEHYPCDTFYPKPKWYSPFTWKYRKYAKFDYYSGPCEVKKEEHCLPFWGKDLPDDASEATWYTVTYASGGGGCHSTETQYFYAKSEAHGLTFTLTNYYYNNEKWVCAIDDISRKSAICTMAGHFGGSYSTPEKCILTFKTHQKGGKCIPHHMALDCGKPPYVETSKFSKIDYRDIPHKDIIQQDLEECNTCDKSTLLSLGGTKYTSCDPEPFENRTITLGRIGGDIRDVLSGDPTNVTITSFPCITTSSQSVDFDFGFSQFRNLAEVRFANWVTGPDGPTVFEDRTVFEFADFGGQSSLTSIYAPRLTGNPNLEVTISSNPVLAKVDLCALKEAGEIDILGNPELVDVKLSELTTLSASIRIHNNPNLTSVDLSALKEAGEIDIGDNPNLAKVDLSALKEAGEIDIFANFNLAKVDLSALKEAGEIDIIGNRELVNVKLSELTTVTSAFEIDNNDGLEQLSLPKLRTTNSLEIIFNENLVGISMPVLETSSNRFWVYLNPALQTLCAPNLVDGGSVCIGDEDGGSGFAGQPSLDAHLSSLVTGTFNGVFAFCYGSGTNPPPNQLNATTVCGVVPDGLFTTAGCSVTSKACKNPKNTKNTKKEKKNKP